MKTRHLFSDRIYVISNSAEAKNSLFRKKEDYHLLQDKINKYLSPICDILAYNLNIDEYVLLIKIKSRESLETFYREKKGNTSLAEDLIPPSSYIFSQQMANFQSGYVKHYNNKYQRSGSLFCSRFARELVESELDASAWVSKINDMQEFRIRKDYWKSDRYRKMLKSGLDQTKYLLCSSKKAYENEIKPGIKGFVLYDTKKLQGCFNGPMIKILDHAIIKKFFMSTMKFLISII